MTWFLLAMLATAPCYYDVQKGIYSRVQDNEAYLVINLSSTEWFSDSDRLVLQTNTEEPPGVAGAQHTLVFRPLECEQVAQYWIKVEFNLVEIGAVWPRPDGRPAFFVRADSESGCFLGSCEVPFRHGNPR